jgi:Zn-dependent protease/CBS domain-containing protein
MRWSWKIGRLAGINVYMHATFVLLLAFILLASWSEKHNLNDTLIAVLFILAIFACVVLHELGHALTARRYGIRTRDIILLPIGGVARLERMPDKPLEELKVALAGPAVNVVIAGGLFLLLEAWGIHATFSQLELVSGDFLERIMAVNLWLAGFNLIPAFPMDGGRVLRALLATRMEYTQATLKAAHIGQALALVFGFVGLFRDPFLLFIALFVWMGAESEASTVQLHTSMDGVPVERVMLTEFRTLQPDDTLAQATDYVLAGFQHDFPVVFGDHVLGILTREDLMKALSAHGSGLHVRDAMRREFEIADSHDMLDQAVRKLGATRVRTIPVERDGRLVGLLNMENIGEYMMIQSALRQSQPRDRGHGPGPGAASGEAKEKPVLMP